MNPSGPTRAKTRIGDQPFGVIVVDKSTGGTSHDVVARLRRILGTRRIGHAGTLDPLATGVLVVAVGPATRFLQFLRLDPKEYVATARFGIATDSYDADGSITSERPVPEDLIAQIDAALPSMLGLQDQLPPMYSAVKVAGRPLYDYAREGQEIERRSRTIHVGEFERTSDLLQPDTVQFRIVCSGGTYVRTLAHDLGERLGAGAHLTALRRTRVGDFGLEHAVALEEVSEERLVPLREALDHIPPLRLDSEELARARHGASIRFSDTAEGRYRLLLSPNDQVVGVAAVKEEGLAHPECLIPAEVELGE